MGFVASSKAIRKGGFLTLERLELLNKIVFSTVLVSVSIELTNRCNTLPTALPMGWSAVGSTRG